jgi:hypothetical protein
VNLLNAGWTHTTGIPLPGGGWTLPHQALTVFLEAAWEQLNQLHDLLIELISDDGHLARVSNDHVLPAVFLQVIN